ITVAITYDEEPDLFADVYNNAPDEYAMRLGESFDIKQDIDDDDDIDTVTGYTEEDYESGAINKIHFIINDKEITKKVDGYSADMYLFHKDDKTFVYLDLLVDNDYHNLYVYKLSDNGVQQVMKDGMYGFRKSLEYKDEFPKEYLEMEYSNSYYPATDPDEFYLMGTFHMLSTADGYAKFGVGANGKPEMKDKYFTLKNFVEAEPFIDVKTDVDCKEVDPETLEETGDAVLAKGAKFIPVMTDGETVVIVKDNNEKCYKLDVKSEGRYATQVNGKDINELFENMMFAG
ncbi:MAG: hypothetical protein K6G11_05410, partial [Lachnospiraceae bacterium]|nr:hypothetical protein [Lachnospiraceae bacterium]